MEEKTDVTTQGTQKLTKKENFFQTIKFALFSASAGIIQIVTFTVFNEIIKTQEWLSYLVALVLSVLWNFTFNRKFTFKSAANVPVAMLKVAGYYCVFAPLSTWFEHYGTGALLLNEYLVTAICMVTNLVTEYLFCRFVVYRNSMNTNKLAKKKLELDAERKDDNQ